MFWALFGIFSFISLLFFVLFIFATGIGKESISRWKNKALIRKGGYTNALIFTGDGLLAEVFVKNNEGKFSYMDEHYVRVPKLSFPFKGLQSLMYKQGNPNPLDPYDLDTDNLLSCSELDKVMYQNMNFDFKEWFSKNMIWILLALGVFILLIGINLYFGYSTFEWIRDTAPVVVEQVSTTIVNASSMI
jgi:hypothetical protein